MDRLYELIEIQNAISKERNSEMEGRVYELLVEGKSSKDPARYQGRTRTNKIVTFEPEGDPAISSSVWVRITRAKTWTLEGERVPDD